MVLILARSAEQAPSSNHGKTVATVAWTADTSAIQGVKWEECIELYKGEKKQQVKWYSNGQDSIGGDFGINQGTSQCC